LLCLSKYSRRKEKKTGNCARKQIKFNKSDLMIAILGTWERGNWDVAGRWRDLKEVEVGSGIDGGRDIFGLK
jgi:hypothetical protein